MWSSGVAKATATRITYIHTYIHTFQKLHLFLVFHWSFHKMKIREKFKENKQMKFHMLGLSVIDVLNPGTKNEICVSLVYSGNGNKISFPFPLYTRETQISFFVPGWTMERICKRMVTSSVGNPSSENMKNIPNLFSLWVFQIIHTQDKGWNFSQKKHKNKCECNVNRGASKSITKKGQ
jgi:hypothetical protein